MPVKIKFLDNGRGIEFLASGDVTGKEVIAANTTIYTREHLERLKYKIIDRTDCTTYRVTTEEVEIMANQNIEASKITQDLLIIFVSPTDLQFGLSRMWQVYSEPSGFRSLIFRDRKSADEYIANHFK